MLYVGGCAAIEALADEYEADPDAAGWRPSAYAVSKALANQLVRVWAARESGARFYAAVCPGWVRTALGGDSAPRSVEQGALGPVRLATAPVEQLASGRFWRDEAEISFGIDDAADDAAAAAAE